MKTRNIALAFLTLMAVGCAKEQTAGNENIPAEGKTIVVNMPEMTKTVLGEQTQNGVSVVWSAGDEIAAGSEGTYAVFTLANGEGSVSGTFVLKDGETAPESITEVYFPADARTVPTSQNYVEGSFDTDAMVMSWTGSAEEGITLSHEASALMLTLTGTEEQSVSSIDVICNETTYTLTCAEPVTLSQEGKVFYIAVPGSEAVCNYEVTVHSTKGAPMTKSATHALKAGKIGRLPALPFTQFHNLSAGDYFGGGLVFDVAEKYVKVISLTESKCFWASTQTKSTLIGTAENPEDDGQGNTDLIKSHADFVGNFPAAEWCVALGEGWYLPSRREYNALIDNLKLTAAAGQESAQAILSTYGGDPLTLGTAYYWTCCEKDASKIWCVRLNDKAQGSYNKKGDSGRPVRAVKKIAMTGGETADPKPNNEVVTTLLAPTKDASLGNRVSTSNGVGNGTSMRIRYSSSGEYHLAVFLEFDVRSLNAEKFKEAKLNMTIDKSQPKDAAFPDAYSPMTLDIYPLTDNTWEETASINWPTRGNKFTSITVKNTDTAFEVNLTDLVKEKLNAGEFVFGVQIRTVSASTSGTNLWVYSKESTIEGTQPYLQVTALK